MSQLYNIKRAGYGRQRQASQGAGITLVCGVEEYLATFECAKRISSILGIRELQDLGDGIYDSIPLFKIPFTDMAESLAKVAASYSVALVDIVCEKETSRFVLIWKVDCAKREEVAVIAEEKINLDDY